MLPEQDLILTADQVNQIAELYDEVIVDKETENEDITNPQKVLKAIFKQSRFKGFSLNAGFEYDMKYVKPTNLDGSYPYASYLEDGAPTYIDPSEAMITLTSPNIDTIDEGEVFILMLPTGLGGFSYIDVNGTVGIVNVHPSLNASTFTEGDIVFCKYEGEAGYTLYKPYIKPDPRSPNPYEVDEDGVFNVDVKTHIPSVTTINQMQVDAVATLHTPDGVPAHEYTFNIYTEEEEEYEGEIDLIGEEDFRIELPPIHFELSMHYTQYGVKHYSVYYISYSAIGGYTISLKTHYSNRDNTDETAKVFIVKTNKGFKVVISGSINIISTHVNRVHSPDSVVRIIPEALDVTPTYAEDTIEAVATKDTYAGDITPLMMPTGVPLVENTKGSVAFDSNTNVQTAHVTVGSITVDGDTVDNVMVTQMLYSSTVVWIGVSLTTGFGYVNVHEDDDATTTWEAYNSYEMLEEKVPVEFRNFKSIYDIVYTIRYWTEHVSAGYTFYDYINKGSHHAGLPTSDLNPITFDYAFATYKHAIFRDNIIIMDNYTDEQLSVWRAVIPYETSDLLTNFDIDVFAYQKDDIYTFTDSEIKLIANASKPQLTFKDENGDTTTLELSYSPEFTTNELESRKTGVFYNATNEISTMVGGVSYTDLWETLADDYYLFPTWIVARVGSRLYFLGHNPVTDVQSYDFIEIPHSILIMDVIKAESGIFIIDGMSNLYYYGANDNGEAGDFGGNPVSFASIDTDIISLQSSAGTTIALKEDGLHYSLGVFLDNDEEDTTDYNLVDGKSTSFVLQNVLTGTSAFYLGQGTLTYIKDGTPYAIGDNTSGKILDDSDVEYVTTPVTFTIPTLVDCNIDTGVTYFTTVDGVYAMGDIPNSIPTVTNTLTSYATPTKVSDKRFRGIGEVSNGGFIFIAYSGIKPTLITPHVIGNISGPNYKLIDAHNNGALYTKNERLYFAGSTTGEYKDGVDGNVFNLELGV